MFVAITAALWGFCGCLIMVSGQRGLGWGRSGCIKLWPRLTFMTKEAKCGQRQSFYVSAPEKVEPRVQVRLMRLKWQGWDQNSGLLVSKGSTRLEVLSQPDLNSYYCT